MIRKSKTYNRIFAVFLMLALVMAPFCVKDVRAAEAQEMVPEEGVPEEAMPEEGVPQEGVPEETMPEEGAPVETMPEEAMPETAMPEEGVPEVTVPETAMPEAAGPEAAMPESAGPEAAAPEEAKPEKARAEEAEPEEAETEEEAEGDAAQKKVNKFLSRSAFIGNSVGDGLTLYNRAMGHVPLGDATMLTRVSYSFNNDRKGNSRYLPKYDGVAMRAREAVKKCGAEYVFICMGTNDLYGSAGAERAYDDYIEYLAGIMEDNPDITVFIESCTPTKQGSGVSNEKVSRFNEYMKDYCDAIPKLNYVDIAGPLSDAGGYLSGSYSAGDGIHLNIRAYEVWADTLRSYIYSYIEEKAEQARKKQEREHAAARRNYEKCMRQMEEARHTARQKRLEAEAAEAAKDTETAKVQDEVSPMTPEEFLDHFRSGTLCRLLTFPDSKSLPELDPLPETVPHPDPLPDLQDILPLPDFLKKQPSDLPYSLLSFHQR